jgi:hypothetical protein
LFLALALLGASAGCGSKGNVSGKVTFQGKPLPGGLVTFLPNQGEGIGGSSQINPKDGTYRVEGVSRGTMKVLVQPYTAPSMPPGMAGMKFDNVKDMSSRSIIPEGAEEVQIDEKYHDPEKTPLSCPVKGGEQEFNITVD